MQFVPMTLLEFYENMRTQKKYTDSKPNPST